MERSAVDPGKLIINDPIAVYDRVMTGNREFRGFQDHLGDIMNEGRALLERVTDVNRWGSEPELHEKVALLMRLLSSKSMETTEVVRSLANLLTLLLARHPEQIPVAAQTGLSRFFLDKAKPVAVDIVPSEVWANRTMSRNESPADFVRRVYEIELREKKLTRSLLNKIDPGLYVAFNSWIRDGRHVEDRDLLPSRARPSLDGLTAEEKLERKRQQQRTGSRRYKARISGRSPT